jgi:hypothetical protein
MIDGLLFYGQLTPTPITARTKYIIKLSLSSSSLFGVHDEFPLLELLASEYQAQSVNSRP